MKFSHVNTRSKADAVICGKIVISECKCIVLLSGIQAWRKKNISAGNFVHIFRIDKSVKGLLHWKVSGERIEHYNIYRNQVTGEVFMIHNKTGLAVPIVEFHLRRSLF